MLLPCDNLVYAVIPGPFPVDLVKGLATLWRSLYLEFMIDNNFSQLLTATAWLMFIWDSIDVEARERQHCMVGITL